jgi:hypothetical protein
MSSHILFISFTSYYGSWSLSLSLSLPMSLSLPPLLLLGHLTDQSIFNPVRLSIRTKTTSHRATTQPSSYPGNSTLTQSGVTRQSPQCPYSFLSTQGSCIAWSSHVSSESFQLELLFRLLVLAKFWGICLIASS